MSRPGAKILERPTIALAISYGFSEDWVNDDIFQLWDQFTAIFVLHQSFPEWSFTPRCGGTYHEADDANCKPTRG